MVTLPAFTAIPHPEIDSLVAGAAAGDSAAFDALYRRGASRVYNLVLRSCGEPAEAEDICQEVWTRVHHSIGHLHDAGAFDTWVLRIASRACIDASRRRHVEYDETKLAAMSDGHDVSEGVEGDEQRRFAWQALATLAPRQRIALYLREVEGRHYNEIAEAIGATPSAVETLLFRARHALGRAYGRLAESPDERCERARHLMAVVLDGEGDAAEQRSLRAHLDDCHACQRQMIAQKAGRRTYAALPFLAAAAASPSLLPAAGGGIAGLGALLGLARIGGLFGKAASSSLPVITAATLTMAGAIAVSPPSPGPYGTSPQTSARATVTAPVVARSVSAPLIPPSQLLPVTQLVQTLPSLPVALPQFQQPLPPVQPPLLPNLQLPAGPAPVPAIPPVSAPAPPAQVLDLPPPPSVGLPPASPVLPPLQQALPPVAPPSLPPVNLPPVTIPTLPLPPEITLPSVQLPSLPVVSQLNLPPITVPSVTLPSVTTPPVTVPSVTTPAVTVPPVRVPSVNVGNVLNTPPVTLPPVTVPSVTTPQVTVPQVTVPQVTLPAVTIPGVNQPATTPSTAPAGLPNLTLPVLTPPTQPSAPAPTQPSLMPGVQFPAVNNLLPGLGLNKR